MKKIMLTACAVMLISAALQAQQKRTCGTMENLELRKKQNPALEQKMADDEKKIREWIQAHPSATASTINLPTLKNFTPTGNVEQDRINYAIAKEAHMRSLGNANNRPAVDAKKDAQLRDQKRKNNSFITR